MHYDVIITCSGLGSRLKPITNYQNKALVKLGDKAIISHILDSYPKNCRFIITLGYLMDQVVDYIGINHPDLNVEYVCAHPYDGEGSSLLYSLSKTFHLLDKPFVYNACDTYIDDKKQFDSNTAIVSKTYISNQYRKYTKNIEDVSANIGEFCYTGLCYIKDYKTFVNTTNEILRLNNYSNNLSDAHVIEKMSMNFYETNNWVDIGNFIALEQARKHFHSKICVLEKSDQETYLVNGKILKFFKNDQKVNQLYERSRVLSGCVPKCGKRGNYIFYDWISGETLSKVLNPKILNDFLTWCEENLWIPTLNKDKDFFKDFYIEKAKSRVLQYIEKNGDVLTGSTHCRINFREVENIVELLDNIPVEYKNSVLNYRAHGDLVFENVIKTESGFKLIDWREGFEPCKGSDMLYDIAKMKHNLYFDHATIKNNGFFVKKMPHGAYLFDPGTPPENIELAKQLDAWCAGRQINIRVVDLIVALIQLSSSALHVGEESHLLFYMGWYNLNKALKNE